MAQQTDHIGDTNKMVTAVEWLFKHIEGIRIIDGYEFIKLEEAFKQAKQMEKEQIIDAFWNGDNSDCLSEQNAKEFAEQYYNEKYGSQN